MRLRSGIRLAGSQTRSPCALLLFRGRHAFTLFELVLVMALLIILAAIVYPSFDGMVSSYRVSAASDMVRAAWASARAHAMDEGRPYRFGVVPGKGNFRVAPDSPDFWGGSGSGSESTDGTPDSLVQEESLPKGVRFTTSDSMQNGSLDQSGDSVLPNEATNPGTYSTVAVFLPDGTAREDVEVVFQARGARPLLLRLRGFTGVVTAKPLNGESR